MYYYIYDSFVTHRRHERAIQRVETRITDLGLSGKIGRLTMLNNIKGLVDDALRQSAKTIVVVGNDGTVAQVIDAMAKSNCTLGVIPIGKPNKLAHILGVDDEMQACDILSQRIVQRMDLGKANSSYFLSYCEGSFPKHANMECDESFDIILERGMGVTVYNLHLPDAGGPSQSNPRDGLLEVRVTGGKGGLFGRDGGQSLLPAKKLMIKKEGIRLSLDGIRDIDSPAAISVNPLKLQVIVGRKRHF